MLTAELNRTRKIGVEYEMTLPLVGTGCGNDVQQVIARVLCHGGGKTSQEGRVENQPF